MNSCAFWQSGELWTALIGVVAGFGLAAGKETWDRHRRLQAHWAALTAEVKFCNKIATIYSDAGIMAPSYRLPTIAYANSLPALLSDGDLSEGDALATAEFFVEVESLNRGLDMAQTARENHDNVMLNQEYSRNLGKAANLLVGKSGKKTYYDTMKDVLDRHI